MVKKLKPPSLAPPSTPALPGRKLAQVTMGPLMRHANLTSTIGGAQSGRVAPALDAVDEMADTMGRARRGNKAFASDTLTGQASTLDALFGELLRRAMANMGEYPEAADRYLRLALKTQSNCRATLEALLRAGPPREQIVKHVHVNSGGNAIVADEFHHHAGDRAHEKIAEQCFGLGPDDGQCAALPSPEPSGQPMSMPGAERQEALPVAWRE